MGECVIVYGKSGSGKSRSLLNFGEDEIFLVNVIAKRLPFRKKFKYTMVSDSFWGLLMFVKNELPEDVIVYIVVHEDTSDYGETKIRTIGKLLNEKVCIEGMATIVLRCVVRDGKHMFITQSDGSDISKSPEGMFELEIENDLKFVDQTIREYWGL